ncbi:WXG100 family type VII secretion target [Nonomuraea thailandensis]|uniref:WXG100 family type VII secretion target n=1 Tax=Nonomuraea thailandensis TaxID=1188745 RepID=A0A9X2K5W7_9ACTN|nr:WXG100 family type VII secretion target [Nonomuraea thailandensis]MCP2361942.1 WXG100 family type VII secretion target [Nonomuraea thailandensis]
MSYFGASSSQINLAAGHVTDTAQFIEGLRVATETTSNGLLNADWLGPAANRFRTIMESWDNQMRAVRQDLEGIAEKMGANAITYSMTDDDVQAGVGKVESLINAQVK